MKMRNKLIASFALSAVCGVALAVGGGFLNVATADTSALNISLKSGASIRTTDPIGIRFETTVTGLTAESANYSYGTLVVPTDLLGNAELTHETADVVDIVKKVWVGETESEKTYYAVITDIPETAAGYGRELAARSYYKVNGEYVYSEVTAKRSVAQVAANLLSQGYQDPNGLYANYVNSVAESVEVSASTVEMVVGGKYTLTATTSPANYGVVWESKTPAVATVKDGKITAVAEGTAEIVAKLGEKEAICTVTVKNYIQKDGSEIVYTTEAPTKGNYGLYDGMVRTRTGVYKYSTDAAEWTDKLNVKVGGHLNSANGPGKVAALREFKSYGYNYVTFDIYLEAGAYATISSLINADDYSNGSNTSVGEKLQDDVALTEKNSNITIYDLANFNQEVTNGTEVEDSTWYRVVVDYSQINVDVYAKKAGVYSRIEIGGIKGTIYLDNVRYYGNYNPVNDFTNGYVEYGGNEFLWCTRKSADNVTNELCTEEIGGRTGVYKWDLSKSGGWDDKWAVYETAHSLGSANVDTSLYPYANQDAAYKNLTNRGYNYVTIDVYFGAGALLRTAAPDTTSGKAGPRDDYQAGKAFAKDENDCIEMYYQDAANGNAWTKVEVGATVSTGVWYRLVINHKDTIHTSGQWSAMFFSGTGVFYFDSVRYYSANPFAA